MILFVNACVRERSRTEQLAQSLLKKLSGDVTELNLQKEESLLPLDRERLALRDAVINRGEVTHPILRYAQQFAAADEIVIAAPYWDLSFPALLKIYLELICVTGVTFAYGADGKPHGLCKTKRLFFVTTAGGSARTNAFGFGYIEALCHTFFGIADVRCIYAEGLDIIGTDVPQILEAAKREIDAMACD